jgi:hypothetical protein
MKNALVPALVWLTGLPTFFIALRIALLEKTPLLEF